MRKLFILLTSFAVVLGVVLTTVLGFSACGVNFGTPAYELKTQGGQRLLYVDTSGNLYIGSSQVNTGLSSLPPISSWSNALIVVYSGSPVIAISPSKASLRGEIYGNQVPATVSADLVIKKRSTGEILAVLSHTGDIYSRGTAVYHGGQAGCQEDELFCDLSTGDIVYRDWYCDISSGSCTYTDTVVEDCSDTCSDSDGGKDYFTAGEVNDYRLCSKGDTSCPYTPHSDSCGTGNVLTEWYCSGSDAASTTYDCDNYDCNSDCSEYCNTSTGNIEKFCDDYGCSNDRCTEVGTLSCGVVEECSGASDDDGGDRPLTKGTCKEKYACESSDQQFCPYYPYIDDCTDENTLIEYYVSNGECTSKTYNLLDYASSYCQSLGHSGFCVPASQCIDGEFNIKCCTTVADCPSGNMCYGII